MALEPLAGGVSLLPDDPIATFKSDAPRSAASIDIVPVSGQPFAQALHLKIDKKATNPWGIQLNAVTATPIRAGDVIFVRYYLRCLESKDETAMGITQLMIESGPPEFRRLYELLGSAGKDWEAFSGYFVADKKTMGSPEFPAGKLNIHFRLGFAQQTIELGGIQIVDLGDHARTDNLPVHGTGYRGREANASWRKAAEERIEKIRKADLSVVVTDSSGHPVPGALVTVKMKRHAFGFGTAVPAELLLASGADADRYRETLLQYFNKVVLENDLKWPNWEADRNKAAEGEAWLRSHNIPLRGHNLVWPSLQKHMPADVKGLANNPEALRKRINDHIVEELTAMKGKCLEWDVINELYNNHDAVDLLGRETIVDWFKLAHQIDPASQLFINDYGTIETGQTSNPHTDAYEDTIRFLLAHGAPLMGIGIQSHFGSHLPSPDSVLTGLDRFAKTGLPIEITEYDVDSTDEGLQADFTRDYLTLAFSHPSVSGFMTWGFWEGSHWKPNAAYFRKDWSIKPAGQAWIDLIKKKWWTTETGVTDSNGAFKTRGFLGDYEITVTSNGKSKIIQTKLEKTSAPLTVTLD